VLVSDRKLAFRDSRLSINAKFLIVESKNVVHDVHTRVIGYQARPLKMIRRIFGIDRNVNGFRGKW